MEQTPEQAATGVKKRPTFLTVLCILTFVGTGIMLLASFTQIPDTFLRSSQQQIAIQETKLAQAEAMMPGITEKMTDMILEMAPYKVPTWLIGFMGNLLTLFGAIMMWKRRKIGFYIYVAAELVPFIVSLAFLNGMKMMTSSFSMMGPAFEGIGVALIACFLIFDIAFIIMYGVNLKHMD